MRPAVVLTVSLLALASGAQQTFVLATDAGVCETPVACTCSSRIPAGTIVYVHAFTADSAWCLVAPWSQAETAGVVGWIERFAVGPAVVLATVAAPVDTPHAAPAETSRVVREERSDCGCGLSFEPSFVSGTSSGMSFEVTDLLLGGVPWFARGIFGGSSESAKLRVEGRIANLSGRVVRKAKCILLLVNESGIGVASKRFTVRRFEVGGARDLREEFEIRAGDIGAVVGVEVRCGSCEYGD